MKVKAQQRPPNQLRPGELVTRGFVAEGLSAKRPGLDAPAEKFNEAVRLLAKTRDAFNLKATDPTVFVLELDPIGKDSAERTAAVLTQQPELAAHSGVDPARFQVRLDQFQGCRRLVGNRRALQTSIKDSQRTHGTVARQKCSDAVTVLRAVLAADGPQGFARFGIDISEDQYLELCQWIRPILEQDDEITSERSAQQQQTLKQNQKANENIKKAQGKTRLMQLILKLNNSDEELDPALAEEVVRLYDEAHGAAEKERRGAGR